MGSDSDWQVMQEAVKTLKGFGVASEVRVLSAHRTPAEAAAFAAAAHANGFGAIIAAAGMAAHLAGAMAGHTVLPVIGVPIAAGAMNGLDALLATVQMPPGVPVATVAVDGAQNAAVLAVQMLAAGDPSLWDKLYAHKQAMAQKAAARDERVRAQADAL
jgi:5-(carboxyamino)imidazole ribonucleotide mutase